MSDSSIAGGKGASLGEMTRAGIPVPPGFVVLTSGFERFIEETGLHIEIDTILHSVDHTEVHTVERASEKIQSLIMGAEMPAYIADQITRSFTELNTTWVAVRSSATAEDSLSAAWAGQLDSYLNTTEETLLENVKKCWASLFTPRAIFYRFEKDLHTQKISVAVVVQKMVESEASGVAFSVHPVTEDRNQLIIEAGFGLGEAIVSGQITPDSYVVEKEPRRIIDKNVSIQARGLYRGETEGNEWRDIPEETGEKQVLSDDEIADLSGIILNIEKHYGFPVDIEWARESEEFFIVQSRPITTLSLLRQTPDVNQKKWQVFRSRYIPAMLPILSYWSWPIEDEVGRDVGLVVNIWDKGYYRAVWEEEGYRAVRDYSVSFLLSRIATLGNIRERGIKTGEKAVHLCREFATDVEGATLKSFGDFLSVLDATYNEFTKHSMLLWIFSGDALQAEIKKELSTISEEEQDNIFFALSISDEKSYSHKEEQEFFKIVELAKNKGMDSIVVERAIQDFSHDYFWFPYEYVGPIVWDVSTVRERVRDALANGLIQTDLTVHEAENVVVSEKVKKLFSALQAVSFMQDDRKMLNAQICYYLNNIILGAFAKKLRIPIECIRYLESDLLDSLLMNRIDEADFRKELSERAKFCVVIQDGKKTQVYSGSCAKEKLRELAIQEEERLSDRSLQGQVAYKGTATGRVKIIHSSSEAKDFTNGCVLVTGMTTPDFIPIMKQASAIVTDEGGVTSHAAIVSRELGIPCIIGTKIATQVLQDGDMVEVDATNGVVRLLEAE